MKTICPFSAVWNPRCSHSLPALISLLLLVFISFNSKAQINAYAKVTAIAGAKLTLANVNTTYDATGFTVGKQVIIMQMQDKVIGGNTGNSSAFGNLSGIANTGLYEVGTITAVAPATGTPTSITLSMIPLNAYTIGTNSSVQVISFRNMGTNYTVSANITALPWNGNIGGVVAIQVAGTLTLSKSITANGQGFRGGLASLNNYQQTNCDRDTYITSSSNYAYKGEGIYRLTDSTYTKSRGKILSGGGGGSVNNGGGGGGGNYTGGGTGGQGWTCTATTVAGGLGGIALSGSSAVGRIFMGGGGGGGQQNDDEGTNGGNGGGIIFIKAATLATPASCSGGVAITANGTSVPSSGNDGAGGGGAGGTIVLQVNNITVTGGCPLQVRSNGGDGSDVDAPYSLGGGGGGGQGVIYSIVNLLATANVSASTNNGNGGLNSNLTGATTAGSGTGTNNAGLVAGSFTVLPLTLHSFTAVLKEDNGLLNWHTAGEYQGTVFTVQRSASGINFENIGTVAGAGNGTTAKTYTFIDKTIPAGKNFYRLEIMEPSGRKTYSATVLLSSDDVQSTVLGIYPNPARQQFAVQVNGIVEKSYKLVIADLTGNIMYQHTYQPVNGLVEVTPGRHIPPGTYFIQLTGNNTMQFGKVIIQ